jgi:ppGpp synthetase/RelA/SpoT-type nucleotidyltranferase
VNEEEYLSKYRSEIPSLQAWGNYLIQKINTLIQKEYGEESYSDWIKIPPSIRTKNEDSLILKAFLRNKGWFQNIYEDITDKVGIRYVVGLTDQIEMITKLINGSDLWLCTQSREFNEWINSDPRIFDYQSAHLVLTSHQDVDFNGTKIPSGTSCELQIRTLLQHAYAELSHDTLYKSSITSQPEVHRLFAKSMALMETTDDMLLRAKLKSDETAAILLRWKKRVYELNKIHLSGLNFSAAAREDDFLLDKIRKLLSEDLEDDFFQFMIDNADLLARKIKTRQGYNSAFRINSISLIYFLSDRKRFLLPHYFPLDRSILEKTYSDLGLAPSWTAG